MSRRITHVGFSDESNWNSGQFRSLSLVTLPIEALATVSEELRNLLNDSGVAEFKWKKLRGARERFAAIKMINFAVKYAHAGILRIDALIWDINDSRHNIQGRDDIANLQRMYYHLFRNVLRMRWPDNAVWQLFPDEHTALDWQRIEDFLDASGSRLIIEHLLFGARLRRDFHIGEINQASSKEQPLLQLADLFAGLAVFSRERFEQYQKWIRNREGQSILFNIREEEDNDAISSADRERFQVLAHLDGVCKNHKLGVSLRTYRGLTTLNPANPINFWLYHPQHPDDKAPTRERGRRG